VPGPPSSGEADVDSITAAAAASLVAAAAETQAAGGGKAGPTRNAGGGVKSGGGAALGRGRAGARLLKGRAVASCRIFDEFGRELPGEEDGDVREGAEVRIIYAEALRMSNCGC
jgi:hypothetical protein